MPAGVDELSLSYVVKFGKEGFREFLQAGISPEHFDRDYRNVWGYIMRMATSHDSIPSASQLRTRFPHFRPVQTKREHLPIILEDLKQRYKYIRFLTTASDVASTLGDGWDGIDGALERTIAEYTNLLNENGQSKKLVDLFSEDTSQQMVAEMTKRRNDPGIPTGLAALDAMTGGLRRGNMVVVIARTGNAKTWLNLFLVARAIISGHKVALFPLEMTMWETAARLYTIFSALLTPKAILSNQALLYGQVTQQKLHRFMDFLRERYEGQLFISDSVQHRDSYTLERITAEVEGLRPDMMWVDYLTLLQPSSGAEGFEGIRELSRGIKHIAMKVNCVGGCSAQVNRAGVSQVGAAPIIPRLEHIAYGDSIGHDADLVVGLAKPTKKDMLYWALVKHRHGSEIPRQKMVFKPDEGLLHEMAKTTASPN